MTFKLLFLYAIDANMLEHWQLLNSVLPCNRRCTFMPFTLAVFKLSKIAQNLIGKNVQLA